MHDERHHHSLWYSFHLGFAQSDRRASKAASQECKEGSEVGEGRGGCGRTKDKKEQVRGGGDGLERSDSILPTIPRIARPAHHYN